METTGLLAACCKKMKQDPRKHFMVILIDD